MFLVTGSAAMGVTATESTYESKFRTDIGGEGVEEDALILAQILPFFVCFFGGGGKFGNLFIAFVFAFLKFCFPFNELLKLKL